MNNDLLTALATLRSDPEDGQALALLAGLQPGDVSATERDSVQVALAAERAWHTDRENVEPCLRLLDLELAWGQDPIRRATLFVEKARLLHREMCQWESAHACVNEALEIARNHPAAVEFRRVLEEEEAGWQERADTLVRQAEEAGESPTGAPLLAAAGELYLRYRSLTNEGETLFRRSLALDAHHHRADVLMERLLRGAGRKDELAAHLQRRIEAAGNPQDLATARAAAGRLAEQVNRTDQAFEHYREALVAVPGHERALHGVARILKARGKWAELAAVYETALRTAKRGLVEGPILTALGELYWKRLDQIAQAEACFRRARKTMPAGTAVLDFYREYHLQRDEIPQLFALLGQVQKAESDPDARVRYGIEMAELAERRPQLLEKAVDAWKALRRLKPGLPEAVSALRRLYTKTEKWNALLELLKERCESLPAEAIDEKVALYLEMIPIYRNHLKLDVMVVNTYAAILALRPDHAEALSALAERYQAQGRWGDLANILARQAQTSAQPAEKVALYHRVAQLWMEKFNNHHNAVAALEKVLELAPSDAKARATLREIYVRARSWRALLDFLRRELPLLDASARQTRLAEMATLAADRLADLRQAIALWNEVLELAPRDRDAVVALSVLYEREKRWPALTEVLGRLAESAGGDATPEGCALLEKRGLILFEKLGAPAAAVEGLARVRRSQSENPRVLRALRDAYTQLGDFDSLEELYAGRGAWEELCEVLSQVAERTTDNALRVRLLGRVADVARGKLNQPERVLKAYEGILATDPENRAVARATADLYEATERWGRLVATYEILLGPESAPALSVGESLAILERARFICEAKLQAKSLAFKWCARAYRLAPTDEDVRADLERMGEAAEEWEALLGLLAARLGSEGADAAGPDEQISLLRRCMFIAGERVDRPDDLKRFAERILALVPGDDEAENALLKLYTKGERWADLIALQHVRQARMQDPSLRAELLLRIAHMQEERLGDRSAAAATLREACEVEPLNMRLLRELARVLEAVGDLRGLVETLARQVDLCVDADRAAVLLRMGRLLETSLAQPAPATDAYLQVLEVDAISAEAVEGLERLFAANALRQEDIARVAKRLLPYYELTERFDKWAGMLEALVSVTADASERRGHLELLADLYQGPLADAVAAFGALLRVFEIDPANPSVRERLVLLAVEAGKLPALAEAARRVLDSVEEPSLRQEILMHIAEVEERQPDRKSEAEAALRAVLELDPLHMGAYRALARLVRDGERWGALRDLIEAREQHLPDVKERLALLWQAVEIDEALLYDRDHATEILRRIRELDPTDLRACRVLERNYAAAERWRDLDELLVHEVDLVPREELPELKLRRAEIALVRFSNASAALDLLAEVLELAPGHARAVGLTERVLDDPEQRRRAAMMLEPLYAAAGNWARLVEILDIEREGQEGPAAVTLLERKAEVQETRLQLPGAAWETRRAVLVCDPQSETALREAERLAGVLGFWSDLQALYQELAGKRDASDIAGVADLLSRAARLFQGPLAERSAAIRIWRRVLDLDLSNAQTGAPAAAALETLYAETGDVQGLVYVLRARSEWAEDHRERAALGLRIADLEENSLRNLPAAVASYRSLLDGEGEAAEKAFENLERIFQQSGQARERVELLHRRAEMVEAAVRNQLRQRMATILETELHDVDEAIATIRPVLDDNPDDVGVLRTLARLYQNKGAAAEHLEILERLLVLADTDRDRIDLLRPIAGLLQGPLGRRTEALERWREILKLAPHEADALAEMERMLDDSDISLRFAAAETLEPIYQASGDGPRLARILRVFIELAEDAGARASYRARLADIEENKLNDKQAALHTWAAAIRDGTSDPDLGRLLDSYERLALAAGIDNVIEIIDLYRAIEPDVLAEETRLRVQRAVADHALVLGDLPLAIDYFSRITERRPDDDAALGALERIYRQQGNLASLYEVILRRADLADIPSVEVALRREAANLAVRLTRKDEAIAAWERVWTLLPGDAEAVAALYALYVELRRWDDLVNLIERRLERDLSRDQDIDLRFRLAQIQRIELANRERALEYLGQVLEREPDHAASIQILQDLLEDPEARMTAASLLEPVYIRRSAWKELVGIDSLRLKYSEDPEQRLAWTQRIAQVYEEQIEDLDEAFNWYGRVFQEKATERSALDQLLRLAPKLGRWRDLGKLLDEFLDNELSNPDEVLALVRVAIRVYDQELGDRDAARRHYRRYLEAQPANRAAAELFEEALERWEAWTELRDLLDEQARIVEAPAERAELLRRSARISEENLSQSSAAVDSLRAVLEIDPDDALASASLEQLLAAAERWEELRDHLVWMLGRADEVTAKDAITLELAEVEGKRLGHASLAVDYYGEVLGRTPGHSNAIAALEGMLGDSEQRMRVAELLEPAYRTLGNLRKLSDILEVRLETVEDPPRRVAALREKAAAEVMLGRAADALNALGRAWLEDVADAATLTELEGLAVAANGWQRLVAIIDQGIEATLVPDLRADLYARKAGILEERLAAPALAIEAWREAIASRSDHQQAFAAVERLLEAAGRSAELAETLEKHAEVVVEAREREQLTRRVAVLHERVLGQPEKAIAAWRAVLDLDQENAEALDALERLYSERGDWSSLAEVLQRKIEGSHDVVTLRGLWFQAARLHDDKLNDASEAASQLRSILDIDPDDAEALEFLSRIYDREGQHAELVEVLDARARGAGRAEERDTLALRAAQLVQTELSDVGGAVQRYRAILERTPNHEPARAALWELARHEDHRATAVAVLEPVLRAGQEWRSLVELLELRLLGEDEPARRLATLAEMARVAEKDLQDAGAAFAVWARALGEDAGDATARAALERLAAAHGALPELAKIYEDCLKSSYDTHVQRWLASRLAALYEQSLGNPARAVELWREVAGMPGGEAEALGHLEILLRGLERHSELEEVLARQAEIAMHGPTQADFWAALGELRLQHLSDIDGAIDAFRAALERVPTQAAALAALRALAAGAEPLPAVLDILEPLAEARGDFVELAALAEARLLRTDDAIERAGLWRRIAELAETRLGDLPRALEALGRALREDPHAFDTADQLERVAERAGAPVEAASRLEVVLDALDGSTLAQMGMRAASQYLAAGGVDNEAAAERIYARVLEVDAENVAALEAVEALYRRRGDGRKVAAMLERRGALELEPTRRLALYGEAAGLHEASGDLALAIAAWRSGREGDESNVQALDELARLYEKAGQLEGLVEALTDKSHVIDDNVERAALYLRIGTLKAGPLADLDGAAAAFREALDLQSEDSVALAALADIEERRGDYAALEEALLRQLSAASGLGCVPVLTRLAHNAADRLNDADRALVYLHQVLDADAENREAFAETERILASLERWHELIEVLERRADVEARTGHAQEELACRVSVASIWGEKLGATDSALEALQAVLARDPRHFPSWLAVAQIHETDERWDEAAEALKQATELASSSQDRATLLCRMARVRNATGAAADEVSALYHSALDQDPACLAAVMALEEMARAANDPAQLVQVLEAREALEGDAGKRKALLSEMASLYAGPLARPDQAVGPLGRLLSLSPEDVVVQERLGTMLIAAGRVDEGEVALSQLADQFARAKQPKNVARLQFLLGGFAETRGDLAAAKKRFLAAYQIDPTQAATLAALAHLSVAQGDSENARKYYRTLLLQSFDEKAVGLSKAQIYLALGKLHQEAGELPKARNMFERGLEIDVKSDALRQALAALPK
jgi:tetratricopeptide (TPR) repeat protein